MKHAATSKLLAMLAVLVLAAAGAAAASTTARTVSPAEHVRALERARLKAMVDADTAAVGRQLAPDFRGINVLGINEGRSGTLATILSPIFSSVRASEPSSSP